MDIVRFGLGHNQREKLGLSFLIEMCWVVRRPKNSDGKGVDWDGPIEYWNFETKTWGPRENATELTDEWMEGKDRWKIMEEIPGRSWWYHEESS